MLPVSFQPVAPGIFAEGPFSCFSWQKAALLFYWVPIFTYSINFTIYCKIMIKSTLKIKNKIYNINWGDLRYDC